MSIKKIHKEQPETFKFNEKSMEAANKIVSNYPDGKQQSAVMAFLKIWLCISLLVTVSNCHFAFELYITKP